MKGGRGRNTSQLRGFCAANDFTGGAPALPVRYQRRDVQQVGSWRSGLLIPAGTEAGFGPSAGLLVCGRLCRLFLGRLLRRQLLGHQLYVAPEIVELVGEIAR